MNVTFLGIKEPLVFETHSTNSSPSMCHTTDDRMSHGLWFFFLFTSDALNRKISMQYAEIAHTNFDQQKYY